MGLSYRSSFDCPFALYPTAAELNTTRQIHTRSVLPLDGRLKGKFGRTSYRKFLSLHSAVTNEHSPEMFDREERLCLSTR